MIRPDLMIRYSISSDLTAFANISRISTEDFPLVSNHLPNDNMTNAKMKTVMITYYGNVGDEF